MLIEVLPGTALDQGLVSQWRAVQSSNPELDSPFFSPEFTQAASSSIPQTEVIIASQRGAPEAFLPFQRSLSKIAVPVAGKLNDYQAIVSARDFQCDPRDLLRGAGLVAFDFDHMLASQATFSRYHRSVSMSPRMDLSNGYEAFVAGRREAGSALIKKCANLSRRLEREVGPLRYVGDSRDTNAFDTVLHWKSLQFLAAGAPDLFSLPWARRLVSRLFDCRAAQCAGTLSLLYAGDDLIAGHFGVRSPTVWHYWFPSYSVAHAKYSPGLLLLLAMANAAAAMGIHCIDLGKGKSLYKERVMTYGVPLATGSVELASLRLTGRAARRCVQRVRSCSLFRGVVHMLRRWSTFTRSFLQ